MRMIKETVQYGTIDSEYMIHYLQHWFPWIPVFLEAFANTHKNVISSEGAMHLQDLNFTLKCAIMNEMKLVSNKTLSFFCDNNSFHIFHLRKVLLKMYNLR